MDNTINNGNVPGNQPTTNTAGEGNRRHGVLGGRQVRVLDSSRQPPRRREGIVRPRNPPPQPLIRHQGIRQPPNPPAPNPPAQDNDPQVGSNLDNTAASRVTSTVVLGRNETTHAHGNLTTTSNPGSAEPEGDLSAARPPINGRRLVGEAFQSEATIRTNNTRDPG